MLTEKQQRVLDVITEFISKYGKSPTIEELKNMLQQKSKRGVVQYLEALEKKWFITRSEGYRGIMLWNGLGFQTTLNIPILGFANAGRPLAIADQNMYGFLPISKKIVSDNADNYFVLRVEGTSMNNYEVKGKTIENGSYVLIDTVKTSPNSSDAFLFIVNGAATLKKYKKDGENVYLLPDSKDDYHKPIILSSDDTLSINGTIKDVYNF